MSVAILATDIVGRRNVGRHCRSPKWHCRHYSTPCSWLEHASLACLQSSPHLPRLTHAVR